MDGKLQHDASSVDFSQVAIKELQLLFQEQQRYLNHCFDHLDFEPIHNFCKTCLQCKGVIFFTGVGKSGFIAQKVSQTFVSTGSKAVYLNPTDALHGDLGIVSQADMVVCFSKSGDTDELLRLVPYAKAKGAQLVSVTSVQGCKLAQQCHMAIHLPLERELCPFDMAPVTSTALQLIWGDTLAIALMQAKHMTREQFAMNHPAGRIGRRLMLRVGDCMLSGDRIPVARPGDSIMGCLDELTRKSCGCVLVTGPQQQLLGTFTDGDLRRTLQAQGPGIFELKVEQCMHANPRTCTADVKAVDALHEMEDGPRKVGFLPVLDGATLVGIVTLHGLVSAGL